VDKAAKFFDALFTVSYFSTSVLKITETTLDTISQGVNRSIDLVQTCRNFLAGKIGTPPIVRALIR
jgi:hypothetical protein